MGIERENVHSRSLFDCISVTDDIKINEQNHPIAKGPLYVYTNRIWSDLSVPAESYGEFEPLGVSDVAILAWTTPQNVLYHREMV